MPLPGLCVTALKIRRRQQDADAARAGAAWIEPGLVFFTRHGTPIEPWMPPAEARQRGIGGDVKRVVVNLLSVGTAAAIAYAVRRFGNYGPRSKGN